MDALERMDADDLALALKDHLPLPIVNLLKEQLVSGSCFINLTESTLKLFNFPMGHIFAIMKVVSEIAAGTRVLQVSSPEKTSASEHEVNPTRVVLPLQAKDTNQTNSREVVISDQEVDELLAELISDNYLKKASPYIKASWRAKVRNWKALIMLDLPHSAAPNLMIPEKYLKRKNQTDDDELTASTSKVKKGPKKSGSKKKTPESTDSNVSSDETSNISIEASIKRTSNAKSRSERVSTRSEKQKESASKSSEANKRGHSSDSSSEFTIRTSEEGSGNSDEGRVEDRSAKVTSFNAPLPLRTDEELKNISPSLPSFDIESILLDDENGKERTKSLVPLLKAGKLLGSKERKNFFRKLVNYLCFKYVEDPSKATAPMREGLAKSIVVTYPQYQKAIDVEGKTPWSYIWNTKGGHINNVIKRIQTALPDSKRAKKGRVNKKKKKKVPSCNLDIKQLALLMPDRTNRVEIFDGMKKSFPLRSCARDKGSSITEILSDFPHLLNYSGELIAAEYQEMFPNSKDMCPDMAKFVPKVIRNWDDDTIEVKCKDDNVKACLILASKLPHKIRSKIAIPQEEEIIVLVKPGVDLETFVAERRIDGKGKPVQPYLIGLRGQLTSEILKYFLVLDGNLLELGRIPFLRCIDWLFKTYVVFNVHYPSTWSQFFRFLQTCFYKIYFTSNDDVPPSSIDLFNKLSAL